MREQKITQGIFFIPLISLGIFFTLLFVVIVTYFDKFREAGLKNYQNYIIETKKEYTKNMLLSEIQDINHDIVDLNNNIKKELKERVDEASNIIERVTKNNPTLTQKEQKKLIKQILSSIRFNNGRGYYFAYDKTTKINKIHPIKRFVNKDMSNFKDKRGIYLTKLFDKIIEKNNSGYAEIYFAKPSNPNKEFKKIVYLKYIPKFNWVIGTGEYTDDAMNELKKELLEEITNKRYGKNGYFWVHNANYTLLAHPFRQKDINKNDENLTDIKGTKIIQMFIKKAKENKDGAFVEYYWKNPNNDEIDKKISFVYFIPQFNWVIGTGLYLKDLKPILEDKASFIKHKFENFVTTLFVILIITLFISFIISFFLSKRTRKLFDIYKNDLENKIAKAVEENTKKDKLLQQQSKLAAMGEMINAIAHQWRQPLNSLGLNIQLLIDDYLDGKIDEEYLEKFEKKEMEIIKFMSKTIDDFKNFFQTNKEKEPFSVIEEINKVKSIISAQLKAHNISIEIKGDDFIINGYKSEFNQVILNLINNAKDAILEKNIQDGKIDIILDNHKIIIQDNGKEIPENVKNRIFEPYFTTKEKGTGIGLYMSKMIIERMGGELYFQDKPKQFIIKGLK